MEEEKEPRKSEEPHGPTTAKPQKMDTDAIRITSFPGRSLKETQTHEQDKSIDVSG